MAKKKTEDFEKLQGELDGLRDLATQLENQLKRAVADYHNLEKRVAEGRSELTKWGTGELLTKILPVLDHLEQALSGASEADRQSGWLRGVELAVKELNTVLQSEGLTEIEVQEETLFNPSLHEAVDTGEGPEGMILKVIRKGYNLNSRVLRPTQVVVGKYTSSEQARKEEGEINNG